MYLNALSRRPRHQLGELGFSIGGALKKIGKTISKPLGISGAVAEKLGVKKAVKKLAKGVEDKLRDPLKQVASIVPGVGDAIAAYDVKKLSAKEAKELAKMTKAEQDAFLVRKAEIEHRNRNIAIIGVVGLGVAGLIYMARRK